MKTALIYLAAVTLVATVVTSVTTSARASMPVPTGTAFSTPDRHVFSTPQPHDCEFSWSPLGNKGCHYEKQVTQTETRTPTADWIDVYESWEKVDD